MKAVIESALSQVLTFTSAYVNENRRQQARTWAMLYVNSLKCLIVSTATLSFLSSGTKANSSRISLFEYALLWCSMIYLPLVAAYLITACFADYFGFTSIVLGYIDDALKLHAFYGLSPTNASASLYDPPKFLGYIKVNQKCETKEDGEGNLRVSGSCLVDGALHYTLAPKKAAAVLGFKNVVPSNYVRSARVVIEDIKLELVLLKPEELQKSKLAEFDKDLAKLMTRFCALSYEISKSSEGIEVENDLEFTLLERYGFPSDIKCQVLFQDKRWPQNHAVAFWCPEDRWITVAFKGADAWNIEKQMLNVCNDTVTLPNNSKCHMVVWEQLCGVNNGDAPYPAICNRLESIYSTSWASDPKPALFLTGQGIGGSIAELFLYMKLSSNRSSERSLIGYSFGSLAIGDDSFCSDFNGKIANFEGVSSLFTIHNSLDLFATLPIGLASPGCHIDLYLSWDLLLDTPFVHLTDLMFWSGRLLQSFVYSQSKNLVNAARGDKKALLSIIFWIWCNPSKPFSDRLPISYFRNLNDPDIRVVVSNASSSGTE